ncbi:MAG TPA: hypothetical protein VFY16_14110 [Gemmatimonadaceae bacterium]|nr:hypothetical protein [Gemmatimonadaceae bacterium]
MRRLARPLVLLALAGCASSSSSTDLTRARTERPLIVDDVLITTTNETRGVGGTVDAPPDKVWRALTAAYVGLGLETRTYDPASGQIGNINVRLIRRLNGVPLSTYFDCGTGFSGPNADDHRLRVNVISYLRAQGPSRTLVETQVQAFATNVEGTSRHEFACTSKGALEARILEFVTEHVGG